MVKAERAVKGVGTESNGDEISSSLSPFLLFGRKAKAIVTETFFHPLSTSTIVIKPQETIIHRDIWS